MQGGLGVDCDEDPNASERLKMHREPRPEDVGEGGGVVAGGIRPIGGAEMRRNA